MVLQIALDRWNPSRRTWKLADHHGLGIAAVERIISKESFQAEVTKQEAISLGRCGEVSIEDRRTRVADLQALFSKVPNRRVALKLKILSQVREEVGDSL